mmetsp:Transcript_11757/g.30432  ORF Transcript_11757/g.30432 Transcript_11757/m.30432 type:complete len:404 (+) Transcript_11757:39-1250(+)
MRARATLCALAVLLSVAAGAAAQGSSDSCDGIVCPSGRFCEVVPGYDPPRGPECFCNPGTQAQGGVCVPATTCETETSPGFECGTAFCGDDFGAVGPGCVFPGFLFDTCEDAEEAGAVCGRGRECRVVFYENDRWSGDIAYCAPTSCAINNGDCETPFDCQDRATGPVCVCSEGTYPTEDGDCLATSCAANNGNGDCFFPFECEDTNLGPTCVCPEGTFPTEDDEDCAQSDLAATDSTGEEEEEEEEGIGARFSFVSSPFPDWIDTDRFSFQTAPAETSEIFPKGHPLRDLPMDPYKEKISAFLSDDPKFSSITNYHHTFVGTIPWQPGRSEAFAREDTSLPTEPSDLVEDLLGGLSGTSAAAELQESSLNDRLAELNLRDTSDPSDAMGRANFRTSLPLLLG